MVAPPDFESFAAEYFLERDADGRAQLRVIETIVAVYPETNVNRGFYRDLPKYYQEVPLDPQITSVTDAAGAPVPYAIEDYDRGDGLDLQYTSIAIGDDDYLHGRHEYRIEYTLQDVVGYFADTDTDQFYWDVNGVDTATGIDRVSLTLHLDDELVDALQPGESCYPGYYSQATGCSFERSDDGATFTTSVTDVSAYDTLTITIVFEPGTFTPGERITAHWIYAILPPVLFGLAVLLLIAAIVHRFTRWRDAPGRGTIIAQYTAPEDHDLVLAADVIGKGHEALSAGFVGLAVRGFVEVIDLRPRQGGDDADRFALRFRNRDGATAAELRLLKALFDDFAEGEEVRLGSIDAAAGAELYALGLRARDRAVASGLRALPKPGLDRLLRVLSWPVVLAFAVPIGWASLLEVSWGPILGWLIATIGAAFVQKLVLRRPYLLTEKGAEVRDHLRGMRVYLDLAEEERLRVLQSTTGALRVDTKDRGAVVRLNEKLLPYAMLWDVERSWSEALEVQYAATGVGASWLGAGVSTNQLDRTLASFAASSTSRVRPIVPVSTSGGGGGGGSPWSGGSSSFRSGSFGGGFSGGGGGGGGMRGR